MAATLPLPPNHCRGTNADGTPDNEFYCLKEIDNDGNPVYSCVTMRYFKVTCTAINQQCNSLSGAYVAAVTICNQKLYN